MNGCEIKFIFNVAHASHNMKHFSLNFFISHLLGLAGDVHFISVRKEGSKGSFLDDTVLQMHKEEFEEYSIQDIILKDHFTSDLDIGM